MTKKKNERIEKTQLMYNNGANLDSPIKKHDLVSFTIIFFYAAEKNTFVFCCIKKYDRKIHKIKIKKCFVLLNGLKMVSEI